MILYKQFATCMGLDRSSVKYCVSILPPPKCRNILRHCLVQLQKMLLLITALLVKGNPVKFNHSIPPIFPPFPLFFSYLPPFLPNPDFCYAKTNN